MAVNNYIRPTKGYFYYGSTEEDLEIARGELAGLERKAASGNLTDIEFLAQCYRAGTHGPLNLEKAASIDLWGALEGSDSCRTHLYAYMLMTLMIERHSAPKSAISEIDAMNTKLIEGKRATRLSRLINIVLRVEQNLSLPLSYQARDSSTIHGLSELYLWWSISNEERSKRSQDRLLGVAEDLDLSYAVDTQVIADRAREVSYWKQRMYEKLFLRNSDINLTDDRLYTTPQMEQWLVQDTFTALAKENWSGFRNTSNVNNPVNIVSHFWDDYYKTVEELGREKIMVTIEDSLDDRDNWEDLFGDKWEDLFGELLSSRVSDLSLESALYALAYSVAAENNSETEKVLDLFYGMLFTN
jgi:hypothetical protein